MTDATVPSLDPPPVPRPSDWRLFLRIVPYARPYGRTLLISAILLIPLSLSAIVQPQLIGQAVSLLTNEPTTYGFLRTAGLPRD